MDDPGTSKEIGLKKLCEYLIIGLDEVIVMGGNDNDLSVLKMGCFNIVPENGNKAAKDLANIVSKSVYEKGPLLALKDL